MADDTVETILILGDRRLVRSKTSKAWWEAVRKAAENAPRLTYEADKAPFPVLEAPPADSRDEGFLFHGGEICRASPAGLEALTPEQAAKLLNTLWRKIGEQAQEIEDLENTLEEVYEPR